MLLVGIGIALVGAIAWGVYIITQRQKILSSISPWDPDQLFSATFTAPAKSAQWTVFYNAYIAPDFVYAGLGQRLVEEQLQQVANSYAASANDLVVHTTVIGQPLDATWLHHVCASAGRYQLTCAEPLHYAEADEIVTLTRLHNYCREHADQSVIYLHNKGSLHPGNKGQDRWRRTMTAATTSQQCLAPPLEVGVGQCSACGMLFQTLPALHFPGNMWSAKCSYINQLLSPNDFRTRHRIVDEWVNTQLQIGIFMQRGGLFPMERHYTGRERYVAEHWLGSHPDLLPCDVSKSANKDYWLEENRSFQEFQVAVAPRHDIHANWVWYSYIANNATLADSLERKRDFFLLRGMVFRWLVLYDKIPEWNSWVWTWFPDGELWKEAISTRGSWAAINSVAELPGTAKIEYAEPTPEEAISGMNAGKYQY
jgi:hypothetical protein